MLSVLDLGHLTEMDLAHLTDMEASGFVHNLLSDYDLARVLIHLASCERAHCADRVVRILARVPR